MWRFLLRVAFTLSLIALFAQCGTSDYRPGEQAEIPASDTTVTFAGTTWSDVVFKHAEHSDRYHGECIKCHDHEPIAGQTHWYCRTCHTAGQDRENLCNEVSQHGCVMTQCHNCHEVQGANPGQKCTDCHTSGPVPIGGVQPGTPIVIFTGSIESQSEVDQLYFTLATSGTLIVDVEAWERCANSTKPIPTDFFGDGDSNNNLDSNIFLFQQNGTLVAGCVGSGSSRTPVGSATSCQGPGSHDTRSGHNPYISVSVTAGTYILAIGSADLSEADAWTGVNSDGSYWTNFQSYPSPGYVLYNKYRINLYLN